MSAVRGEPTLVRICDLAGRPRGTGFLADDVGTVVTSHEAVDGLSRLVVHAPGGHSGLAEHADITPLPEWDLALVRTTGLELSPLVIGAERPHAGSPVTIFTADGPLDATLAGTVAATYTSTDRYHPLEQVLELALPEAAGLQLRLSRPASGAPVLDTATGAVLGVLGTALHVPGRTSGFAVPLYAAGLLAPDGPLGVLLRRNGASVPGFGPDLNLAGALQLTATSVGPAVERCAHAVARPETAAEFEAFAAGDASVVGLVGEPGSGRTTELAALAGRRARGVAPAPTVWLRGAELRAGDNSVREAVGRALASAGRIVSASREAMNGGPVVGDPREANPDVIARLARAQGRPLLVLLDAPEEMPPQLAHGLRQWTAGTASWLRASGARMAVACRPEYWEQAGALFPADMLYVPGGAPRAREGAGASGVAGVVGAPGGGPLPGCVRLGDLAVRQAVRARAGYGLSDSALAPGDQGHPLTMRMLAGIRAAQAVPEQARPTRAEVFAGHLDLMCLRVAVRLAAGERTGARPYGGAGAGAVRRLAARVAGQVHEAARRCLGPGQGELSRAGFEELFPWVGGWASAVLAEGLLAPAGEGYRFADEEFADWLQGRHLELDGALDALVHRRNDTAAVPVPRHRIGPVVQALLLCGRRDGPRVLGPRLRRLLEELARRSAAGGASAADESAWWAAHLLGETLARVPDARPYVRVLRGLAELVAGVRGGGGAEVDPGSGLRAGAASGSGSGSDSDSGSGSGAGSGARVDSGSDAGPGAASGSGSGAGLGSGAGSGSGPGAGSGSGFGSGVGARGGVLEGFGPWFWRRLPLRVADKAELLRVLLPADPPYGAEPAVPGPRAQAAVRTEGTSGAARDGGERYLDVLGELLAAEPRTVQPLLCEWFSDLRPLRQRADVDSRLAPTVATAAQALLHTHRRPAVDALTEALVDAAHPRADELLSELVHDEPAAVCRAVARWAGDERAERRVAAALYGVRAARRVRGETDREPLRAGALALLARPEDHGLHAAALAVLVRDPGARSRHVAEALERFAGSGDPDLASALGTALATHPEPVFAAFQSLLSEGAAGASAAQAQAVWALAQVRTPALARRAAVLVREYAADSPDRAREPVAAFVRHRMRHGPAARAVLIPLVAELLRERDAAFRASVARVLGAGDSGAGCTLRDELLDCLLAAERDPVVLEAVLVAVVRRGAVGAGDGGADSGSGAVVWGVREGELVRRIGLRMGGTAEGAAGYDRTLVRLARELPGFAGAVRAWVRGAPEAWAAVVGPSARRVCDALDPADGPRQP